jgi:WS/DGAT/MGAT family acyltransferase
MGGPSYRRLTAQDSSFLFFEGDDGHAHVTAVAIFEPGALVGPEGSLDIERARAYVDARLHRLPTYRQRLAHTPVQRHAVWVDDERFEIDYHVRHASLARPGGLDQLKELAGQITSVRLDRDRPLWELWFVEGLADGGFAVVAKVHHALVDGVSGVGLLTAILTASPEPVTSALEPWSPKPAPGLVDFLWDGAVSGVRQSLAAIGAVGGALASPRRTASHAAAAALSTWETLGAAFDRPPSTPINRPIGTQRRVDWRALDMAELLDLRKRLDGTLNDVVLAVVAGAMRRYFKARRVRLRGSDLRVIVPVDTRSRPEDAALANRVSAWFVTLPVSERDPLRRFARIRAQTRRRKHARAELVIDLFHRFADWAGSSSLTALGASGVSWLRPYNLIVTNIPGPHFPLYMLGSTLREFVPALPLFANQGLAVTAMSYRGRVYFGLTGDRDVLGDLPEFAEAIEASFAELRAAAEQRP